VGGWRRAGLGGWHGAGGWHGGGFHGGGWRWHAGHWSHGYWHNGWWGPAVVAGVAAGAFATYPCWGGYGYDNGCWAYEPAYDAFGNYLGQQYVNICY
jgi:hypothetical protein